MPISHIRLVNVSVRDQQKALEFYTEGLGFAVQTDQAFGPDQRWLEVVPPGERTAITLTLADAGEPIGTFTGIVLATGDIDATYRELVGRGVEFMEVPEMQPWGVKQVIFADPDGNKFVLVER